MNPPVRGFPQALALCLVLAVAWSVAVAAAAAQNENPSPQATTAPSRPSVIHFCAQNCMTLELRGNRYLVTTPGADPHFSSAWDVERFDKDAVILHRHDIPSGFSPTYRGRISPDGDRLVDILLDGRPTPTIQMTWGAALASIPGSNEERDGRLAATPTPTPAPPAAPVTISPGGLASASVFRMGLSWGRRGASMDNVPATPAGIAIDAIGNIYAADPENGCVRKRTAATGEVTDVVGFCWPRNIDAVNLDGYGGDGGPAIDARLYYPWSVVVDAAGNLLIADTMNGRIRRVDAVTGLISTVYNVGKANSEKFDNGPAVKAGFGQIFGMALDRSGNLFLIDYGGDGRIRKISAATGVITTVAGGRSSGDFKEGATGTNTRLASPRSIALDAHDNLFIADTYEHRVIKVAAGTGIVTTVAGGGKGLNGSGDFGPATAANIADVQGIAVDSVGNLYLTSNGLPTLHKVEADTGQLVPVGADGNAVASGPAGKSKGLRLSSSFGMALDNAGNLFVADGDRGLVYKLPTAAGAAVAVPTNDPKVFHEFPIRERAKLKGLPPTLKVCEGLDRPSFKCWTATWNGKTYDAVLPGGVVSELDIIAFETAAVIITRRDKTGPRAGKMQLYDGHFDIHSIGGTMYPQPTNPDASYLLWEASW